MTKFSTIWIWVLVIATTFSSCEMVGGLMKASFYAGIIVVVLVVLLIIWLVRKMRR
jgi:flagellar biogenesis protein FliO